MGDIRAEGGTVVSTHVIRRFLPPALALALVAVLVPFAQLASANHGNRTLDAEPEMGSRAISDDVENPTQPWVIIATLSQAPTFATGAVNVDFELESGPNNTDGDTTATPDRECAVPAGQTSCQISYTGEEAGTDVWRVWIDHDGLNASQGGTTEADEEEGRNEMTAPGDPLPPNCPGAQPPNGVPEPGPDSEDCTDVVQVTWTQSQDPPVPTTLDCDDSSGPDTEHETNPDQAAPASHETYTCTVLDQYGNPIQDSDPNTTNNQATTVKAEVENEINDPDGPPEGASYDTPDYTCNTSTTATDTGKCNITITQGEVESGTMVICFWVGTAEEGALLCNEPTGPNGEDTGDNLADQVELTYEERGADGLDVETEKETLVVGEERTLTATVYDQFETPFQGDTVVNFEFFKNSPNDPNNDGNTPNTPDASCTTANDTTCEYKYTGEDAGRDLICAWIGEGDPTLKRSSRNARGTCNDEGRIDEDDDETQADPPQAGDRIDVVETTWTNATPATKLNCKPEVAETQRDEKRTFTCKATVDGEGVSDTEVDVEITGMNDPDKSRSFKTPDRRCTTNNQGVCSFSHQGDKKGKSVYTAWTDGDYEDSTVEADKTEGRAAQRQAGANEEPDTTDKVQNNWVK